MSPHFQTYLKAQGHLSPASLSCHRRWLSFLQEHLHQHGLQWEQARPADLEGLRTTLLWHVHLQGRLFSPNSLDQCLRVLRAFYRWAQATGLTEVDPTAAWRLPRVPQPEQPVLAQDQLLALLNLPDLSRPQGLRDQLYLELVVTFGLFSQQCRTLQLEHVQRDHLTLNERSLTLEAIRPALERYLSQGRPALARKPTSFLLLTNRGQPYQSDVAFAMTLTRYAQQLGLAHNITPRILHRSQQAQADRLARRHGVLH